MRYPMNCTQKTLEEIHALGIRLQASRSTEALRSMDQGGQSTRAYAIRFAREISRLKSSDV